jgi:hypothetical protein
VRERREKFIFGATRNLGLPARGAFCGQQPGNFVLGFPLLGNIARDFRSADNFPGGVLNW